MEEKYITDGMRKPRPYDELVMDGTGVSTRSPFSSRAWERPIRYSISRVAYP